MRKPPEGWPRISSSLFYDDAAAAIDFLCKAFGFEIRLKVEGEGGSIEHSELDYGEGLIMVSSVPVRAARKENNPIPCASPKAIDGRVTQALCIHVDSADAHRDRAEAAGAVIAMEPKTDDYGEEYWADRSYRAIDPEGHHWWFIERIATKGKPVAKA